MGKALLAGAACIALIFGMDLGGSYYGWWKSSIFTPKYEQVRRTTFEQSRAFNEGLAQDLTKLRSQYIAADDAHKQLIRDTVTQETADYDLSNLPPALQAWVVSVRGF